MGWDILLGAALEAGLGLLAQAGFEDEIHDAKERLTKRPEKERREAFERAFKKAVDAAGEEELRPLLEHRPFMEAVITGLLDPTQGFDLQVAEEVWKDTLPAHARSLRLFFSALENTLLEDDIWGPILERYQDVRFRRDVVEELQRQQKDVSSAQVVSYASTRIYGDRNVLVEGDVKYSQIFTGNIYVIDPEKLWQAIGKRRPTEDLRKVTESYLKQVVDRYRYLDFRGMGMSDRVAMQLPLLEMYVPLKARIEMPEGETWARQLRLAGRKVSEEEMESMGSRLSEPTPVLELLKKRDGLIILGDPGAGKTTFLKYLALNLAIGESPGLGQRLPVLLPLSAYANVLANGRDVPLDDFIAEYYGGLGVDLPIGPMLGEALAKGGALLLLDGLDEVKELSRRLLVVNRVVDFFSFHKQKGNKFVLTSRIVGYRDVRPVTEGLAECTLVDFEQEEIELFVGKWTAAIERAALGSTQVAEYEAERERRELLDAVHRNSGVRQLASNPLLLTILALMKRQGVTLPERRVELYEQYVKTLLRHWNLARGLGRPPTRDLDVVETVRVLAPLALWMHETSPGVGLVKREDVRRRLVGIYEERNIPDPEAAARRLLEDARDYACLLLERGAGEYGFIHLTFQEYLAAVAIAQKAQRGIEQVVDVLAEHVGDDNWHEVSLLTVGYMGIIQQWDEMAGAALAKLIERAPGEPGEAEVLAGEVVIDVGESGVTHTCKQKVTDALQGAMRDDAHVKPRLRASAGDTLAKLGDPRPEVTTIEGMQFCYVPPGPFIMGSGKDDDMAYDSEMPQRIVDIHYPYWMSRYPVTNAQFAEFVEAGGYGSRKYWTEAEKAGVWKDGMVKGRWDDEPREGPARYREPFGLPSHPVVGVTWYEALAFTRWLTEKLGVEVRLPSEAEWEKAARGGLEIPGVPLIKSVNEVGSVETELAENPNSKRRYPWGDDADPNLANYDDTGIGTTRAVGCFPGGASVYGAEDMSGNVWEWTSSLYKGYPYQVYDGREDPDAGGSRVLRGGSWSSNLRLARVSYRNSDAPDDSGNYVGLRVLFAPVF